MTHKELILKAKQDYPIGTKFVPAHMSSQDDKNYCIITDDSNVNLNDDRPGNTVIFSDIIASNTYYPDLRTRYGNHWASSIYHYRVLYYKGEWARIIYKPEVKRSLKLYRLL